MTTQPPLAPAGLRCAHLLDPLGVAPDRVRLSWVLQGAGTGRAQARPCGLGNAQTLWIDYADNSVPFWQLFARKGVIAAASNFISPPQLRARGAKTVYWDLTFQKRVGTPAEPADPSTIDDRAQRLYDYAVASTGCAKPMIAENELFGAWEPAPWTRSTARYRADVLAYLQELHARGARPVLLLSSSPSTDGEAADWWRQVAQVADIVREVYFVLTCVSRS